ncbi:MAG TPA: hypothetical protein VHL59_13770 [Thermoanaerobaculia bacterium]|nr:hypothetical protein [Thermoanaerobaculia bacterium]
MKRLPLFVTLLLLANAAFAFDATRKPIRVGVLHVADEYRQGSEAYLANGVVRYLREELRNRGLDAFDAKMTYDDLARGDAPRDADYYVELLGAGASSDSYGGIGIGTYDAGVSLEVIVARVAAELRVYDADTLETVARDGLAKRNTAVMPTSVGIGGPRLFAMIAVPFVHAAQYRRVVQAAAREAAARVDAALAGR